MSILHRRKWAGEGRRKWIMDNGKLTIVEVKVLNIDGQDGEWISRGAG
jgi:hypothetical protein